MALTVFAEWTKQDADRLRDLYVLLRLYCLWEPRYPGLTTRKADRKKREALYDVIKETAVSYGIAFASEKEIDEMNILNATFLAMKRAVEKLGVKPDLALIDGNQKPHTGINEVTVIKGDGKSMSIAAASVLAKVTRDRYMIELDKKYPQYEFRKHKGYGTKLHYEKVLEYGISDVHRKTFLKNLEDKR